MELPGKVVFAENSREILTSDLDELAELQANKNRRYIQMKPGKLQIQYMDAALGKVQIFKELFNTGVRIEAAPIKSIVPFAVVFPSSGPYRFCGQSEHGLAQASGGEWDISFNDNLEYIGCAFLREYLYSSYETMAGGEFPKQNLISRIMLTGEAALNAFAIGLNSILQTVHFRAGVLRDAQVRNLLCSQVFKLAFDVMQQPYGFHRPLKELPKRIQGAKKVVEYLQVHAAQLPDIQTLCTVANLSERSLQYGFMEYLGVTPIQYLRIVRLNGARADLLKEQNPEIRVSDIALNWGFLELGRFSREYRQMFMELPSQTLRH